jgi:Asp-tRNA(Asn)/Glu-tRNA(Gln) amidotransferase C subunit
MADPFSVAGSAVGVVSLGIQICMVLERYVSGVKEAKDKTEQIVAETEELANLLELLESIISKVDQSQAVSATRSGITSCAKAISTIKKKLRPDDQASSDRIRSSLKGLVKRLAFPFKEAEIKYWKDVLNTIQQSLQTALLALVMWVPSG